jgi:hypothetical protein
VSKSNGSSASGKTAEERGRKTKVKIATGRQWNVRSPIVKGKKKTGEGERELGIRKRAEKMGGGPCLVLSAPAPVLFLPWCGIAF